MSFRLNQLSFHYQDKEKSCGLASISLELASEQAIVILGSSGSGKTTLLQVLGLLWENVLRRGEVLYHSPRRRQLVDYADLDRANGNDLRLHEFGFVLQSGYLLPHFSCLQNLTLPLQLQGHKEDACIERVKALVSRIDDKQLLRQLSKLPSETSTGQRQRLAALRAIVHDPYVVFADEPVSNLDPDNKKLMLQLLRDWREGRLSLETPAKEPAPHPRTLILVCHELETARNLVQGGWVVVLNKEHGLACSFPGVEWEKHEQNILKALKG